MTKLHRYCLIGAIDSVGEGQFDDVGDVYEYDTLREALVGALGLTDRGRIEWHDDMPEWPEGASEADLVSGLTDAQVEAVVGIMDEIGWFIRPLYLGGQP